MTGLRRYRRSFNLSVFIVDESRSEAFDHKTERDISFLLTDTSSSLLIHPYLEFVRALVYMAFQSVFFGPVGAAATGAPNAAARPTGDECEVALSKLVPANALSLPRDGRLPPENPGVANDAGDASDGGKPAIFSVSLSSRYLSRLFMLRLWRTPSDVDNALVERAGAPKFPVAPNP